MTQALFDAIAAVKAAEELGDLQSAPGTQHSPGTRTATPEEVQEHPWLKDVQIINHTTPSGRTYKTYTLNGQKFRSLKQVKAYVLASKGAALLIVVLADGSHREYLINPLGLHTAADIVKPVLGDERGHLLYGNRKYTHLQKLHDIVDMKVGETYVFGVVPYPPLYMVFAVP